MRSDIAFNPSNLRLARQFHDLTLEQLAERLGVSKQYLGCLETGAKAPGEMQVMALADALDVEPAFFGRIIDDPFRDDECAFRRPASTPRYLRDRVLAHGTLFGMLVARLETLLSLPADDIPTCKATTPAEVEEAAERCRTHWGLGVDRPLSNVVDTFEKAGAVVTTLKSGADKIDAFSRGMPGRRRVMVLTTDKESGSRSRYDAAHEGGHFVLHGYGSTRSREIEEQANRFASAFLMPRLGITREFPRTHSYTLNWDGLFRLKRRWKVSVAAIVRRGFDLGFVSALQYQRAFKHIRWQGWHLGEPGEFEAERPSLVQTAFDGLPRYAHIKPYQLARQLDWRLPTLERVAGIPVPIPKAEVIRLRARGAAASEESGT